MNERVIAAAKRGEYVCELVRIECANASAEVRLVSRRERSDFGLIASEHVVVERRRCVEYGAA